MGQVWRARDARLNRSVAIKILSADVAGDPVRRQRFEQEARALGALNHPNIVSVYDIGQSDGRAYIVSELVEGESLRTAMERGPITGRRLIEIATQTAEAIAAAHALGIVHRDLKPENIMISGPQAGAPGRVKVLDFGLAKHSAPRPGGRPGRPLVPIATPPPCCCRSREWCWARWGICRPSRCAEKTWTRAPIFSASAACSTRWPPASALSKEAPRPT